MTKYVETPEGYIGFPDDMSPDDITKVLNQRYQPPAPQEPEIGPFRAGLRGMRSSGEYLGAAVAQEAGYPETAKRWAESASKFDEETARRYKPKVPSFTDIPGEGVLDTVGRAGQYAYERFMESVPQTGAALAAGAGAMAVAPAAIPAAVAGLAGASAAGLPFFVGQNIKEQMDEGKSIQDTSLGAATLGGAIQAPLDALVGKVFPGVGKAVAGGMILRAIKKGVEGGVIEGLTEGAQQAIQIGQANPQKLFDMPPEVQRELAENFVAGMTVGAGIGGVSGAAQKRKPTVSSPAEEEPKIAGLLPYIIGQPGYPNAYQPQVYPGYGEVGIEPQAPKNPMLALPPPSIIPPNAPTQEQPFPHQPGQVTEAPPSYIGPERQIERVIRSGQPGPGWTVAPHTPPRIPASELNQAAENVYKDMQQQLLREGNAPMLANANAKIIQGFFQTLAKKLGVDAYSLYKRANIKVQKGIRVDKDALEQTLNQDPIPPNMPTHFSALTRALQKIPMKLGSPQQWLNALKKHGVKDEELEWTGVRDFLDPTLKNREYLGSDIAKYAGAIYPIDKYETGNNKASYAEYTLGNFGQNPDSKYREVVLSDAGQPIGTYTSSHFRSVPNPIAHYRTTDRRTADGSSVLTVEEIQSDWHQDARKLGWRQDQEMADIEKAITNARERVRLVIQALELTQGSFNVLDQAAKYGRIERLTHLPRGELADRVRDLQEAYTASKVAQMKPPKAPFHETWPNLTFRHALFDAIAQGKDYIAWPTGEQQVTIQGHSDDHALKSFQEFYDNRLVRYANKLGKPFGAKVEPVEVPSSAGYSYYDAMLGPVENVPESHVHEMMKEVEESLKGLNAEYTHAAETLQEHRSLKDDYAEDFYISRLRALEANKDSFQERINEAQDTLMNLQNALQSGPKEQNQTFWGMKITPEMRDFFIKNGAPLFQRGKTPQANISITPDGYVIRLFKTANESSFIHEAAHLFLNEMTKYAHLNAEIAHDLQKLREWVGNDGGEFTTKQHEKVARGFEQYMRTGKAPNKSLADLFKMFADWLQKIYQRAEDLFKWTGGPIPDHINKVYDRWFEGFGTEQAPQDARNLLVTKNADGTTTLHQGPLGRAADNAVATEVELRLRALKREIGLKDLDVKIFPSMSQLSRRHSWRALMTKEGIVVVAWPADKLTHADFADYHKRENKTPILSKLSSNVNNSVILDPVGQGEWQVSNQNFMSAFRQSYPKSQYLRERGERTAGNIGMLSTEDVFGTPYPDIQSRQTFNQSPMEDESSVYSVGQRAKRGVKAFFDPFSEVPQAEEYRNLRNLMSGGVYAAEQAATKAKTLYDKLSLQEKGVVNDYFETPSADPRTLPAGVRSETVALKKYINGPLKKALIDNNLLPPETEYKHDDSYLPRLYIKYMLEMDFRGSGSKLARTYSRKRKEQTPEGKLAMGEIKDPGVRTFVALFRTQRDLAIKSFMDKIAKNNDWVMPDSLTEWNGHKVTPFWLRSEADAIIDDRIGAEPDPARKEQMRAIAERMRKVADEANKVEFDAKDWKRIPDTRDYGPLRGMVVRKQIAMDIIGTHNFVDPDNTVARWFGDQQSFLTKMTSVWKTLKVPLNPPSQARNFISNMILLNLSGVPIHMVGPRMVQAARDMASKGKYFKIAEKYGIMRGSMTEQELFGVADELRKLDTKDSMGFAGWRAAYRAMLKVGVGAGKLHQKVETWGKVAKIIDAMEGDGLSENEAVQQANKWLFDYSEAHQAIKYLRQAPLGMPFATFQYKVIPLLYEVMTKHPTRLLPYVAMAYTIPALVAASNDIDQDDAEKLRKSLSEALRRKRDMYLLPWKDDAGRWQFIDLGYFMPWQMPKDVLAYLGTAAYEGVAGSGREAVKNLGEAFQSSSLLSNPVINIAAALSTGTDPFTDRPIANKNDTMKEQVWDIVSYLWSLAVPSLFASYGALGQLYNRETGAGVNRYGEPPTTYGQIGARSVGANVNPVIPEAQRARNIQRMQREIQDTKGRMSLSLKDKSLTPGQRRDIVEDFQEEIRDKTKALQEYVRESQMSPRLREATARP